MDTTDAILKSWQNYYVIVGSAAAALTGLVFVVITIVSGDRDRPRSSEGTAIFTTPTVVHFGASLLIAMVLSAPWTHVAYVALLIVCIGVFGLVYVYSNMRRMRRMDVYDPDTEDGIWHVWLPLIAYAAIAIGSCTLFRFPATSMYPFAFASALLLFIGIHNAWDIVTYLTIVRPEADSESGAAAPSNPNAS